MHGVKSGVRRNNELGVGRPPGNGKSENRVKRIFAVVDNKKKKKKYEAPA